MIRLKLIINLIRFNLIVYDNFSNSNSESLNRVEEIVKKSIIIEEGDIRNSVRLKEVFSKYPHF